MIQSSAACFKPDGRMLFRKTGSGDVCLVGLFHFEGAFEIREGASYVATFSDDTIKVFSAAVDPGIPADLEPLTIDYHLRGEIWRRLTTTAAMVVRFIRQWPSVNSWLVYGVAADSPVGEEGYSSTGHGWYDVKQGKMCTITPPAEVMGMTMSQVASWVAVWPDAHGVHHALCTVQYAWRTDYLEYAQLQVALGRGEFSRIEFNKQVMTHPRLCHLVSNPDYEYLRYLVCLDDLDGIQLQAPSSHQQMHERQKLTSAALERSCIMKR